MCGPQLADVETLFQTYKNSDFAVLAVNRQENDPAIEAFVLQSGITFPVLMDEDGAVYNLYKGGGSGSVAPFPRDVVIDKNGRILYYNKIYHPASLRAAIEAGLEGTGILRQQGIPERGFTLFQNHPNPFNPVTVLCYSLGEPADVNLTVIDLHGRVVRTLVKGVQQMGDYELRWDGKDDDGRPVGGGVFICRLQTGDFFQTRKMVFIK